MHPGQRHGCRWTADGWDGIPCGLWSDHDGGHVAYTPGVYLAPLIISPYVRLLTPLTVCTLCGDRAAGVHVEGPMRVVRDGDGTTCWYEDAMGPGDVEMLWQFEPCGCEGREILPRATPELVS